MSPKGNKKLKLKTKNSGYKNKTKSSAKDRFRVTAGGKVKFSRAYKRHNLMRRSNSSKRSECGSSLVKSPDIAVMRVMMPYAKIGGK